MTGDSPDGPSVCVAIPFYSNLGFLRVALRSLVNQSDRRWTAVVVDDCGPEPGADVVVAELGRVPCR
jgi:glycosyltransferase involved in cell wall biosynthesis